MSIEKLKLVSIAGALPALNDALTACLQSGLFHIENAAKLLGAPEGGSAGAEPGSGQADNPFAEPLRALSGFDLQQIPLQSEADAALPAQYAPEEILAETERISARLKDVRTGIETAKKQIAEYESAAIHLKNLTGSDLDLGKLISCRHILSRFGRMPAENLQKLDFYSGDSFVFQAYHTAHDYVWGFYFAERENIPAADTIMKGLLFEPYELPADISGTPEQALEGLQARLKERKAELSDLEAEQKEIYKNEGPEIARLCRCAKYQHEVWRLRSQCLITGEKFTLMGYIPAADEESFTAALGKVPDISVTCEEPFADSKIKPPVRLKNGWFSKPFSMFVEMYGMPDYNGYNPTTFVAITYTLLFGIMFGDLGQGIVLALIGLFLSKKKGAALGGIMTRIGVSSAVFGTLYGSVFGFEEWLDPFWESLGVPFLPLKAMENTNVIIFGAVGIGAAMIIISMLVNIIVKIRRRSYDDGVFGVNGIAGLCFFVTVLLLIGGIVTGKQLIPKGAAIALIVVTMLLMFFREPLGHLMAGKHFESEGIADFIASNFFECFEFLIGYTSNTVSFIRVGGFVFSHAGLMGVVMTLADMIGKDHKSVITVIIGNIFVMCLEGLIVGIQVLRLEFYEIFSRCYDGDGKPFTPISVSFDDLSETQA